MSIPTAGEAYAKLMEHLRQCQDDAALLSHLANANDENLRARGWLGISELLKRMQSQVTTLATRRMQ